MKESSRRELKMNKKLKKFTLSSTTVIASSMLLLSAGKQAEAATALPVQQAMFLESPILINEKPNLLWKKIIEGYVSLDKDRDGTGDIKLANTEVQLLFPSEILFHFTVTDSNGFYQFTNIPSGNYILRFPIALAQEDRDGGIQYENVDVPIYVKTADINEFNLVLQEPAPNDPTVEEPTTEEPTTEAPTTEAPTTEAPTTEAPTTEAPTTEAPTTETPTTEAPTTEAPTTEAPTTEAPTTETPTTETPTTEAPTTEAPTTEAPTTEAPTTEAPTTETPTTEAPTTETPTTEAPTTETPTTEAPTTEIPTTETPTTEAPTTEAPTTEAPTTEAPTTEAPTTEASTTEAPTTERPTTEAPTVETPTTEAPTTERPTLELPTVEIPEVNPPYEIPTVETPTTEVPATERPTLELPTVEIPEMNPSYEIPTVETPTTEAPATERPTLVLPDVIQSHEQEVSSEMDDSSDDVDAITEHREVINREVSSPIRTDVSLASFVPSIENIREEKSKSVVYKKNNSIIGIPGTIIQNDSFSSENNSDYKDESLSSNNDKKTIEEHRSQRSATAASMDELTPLDKLHIELKDESLCAIPALPPTQTTVPEIQVMDIEPVGGSELRGLPTFISGLGGTMLMNDHFSRLIES